MMACIISVGVMMAIVQLFVHQPAVHGQRLIMRRGFREATDEIDRPSHLQATKFDNVYWTDPELHEDSETADTTEEILTRLDEDASQDDVEPEADTDEDVEEETAVEASDDVDDSEVESSAVQEGTGEAEEGSAVQEGDTGEVGDDIEVEAEGDDHTRNESDGEVEIETVVDAPLRVLPPRPGGGGSGRSGGGGMSRSSGSISRSAGMGGANRAGNSYSYHGGNNVNVRTSRSHPAAWMATGAAIATPRRYYGYGGYYGGYPSSYNTYNNYNTYGGCTDPAYCYCDEYGSCYPI